MYVDKKPYCLMPWIHLHIGNQGTAKACCVANIPFGNINDQSLEEIWQGEPIQALREKFLKGEADKRCANCYKLEAAGGKSIRQETFERFPNIDIKKVKQPIYFDIRFSNICNFSCRTCWHGASSKWFNDAKALGNNIGEKAIIKNINDFDDFISKTGETLLQVKEIYFAGGEPLVTEEHYLLLDFLTKNKATHIRLRYNTNFSMLSFKGYEVLDFWKHFPSVEVLASIDATEKLGEYIRKEMHWQTIINNRERIRVLPHVQFKIAPTISVFNVLHLPDLYRECLAQKMISKNDFYINILERPYHYNIKALPKDYKESVIQKYESILQDESIPEKIKAMFQECLDYMMAEDLSKYWNKFLTETSLLDDLREEDLEEVLNFDK